MLDNDEERCQYCFHNGMRLYQIVMPLINEGSLFLCYTCYQELYKYSGKPLEEYTSWQLH